MEALLLTAPEHPTAIASRTLSGRSSATKTHIGKFGTNRLIERKVVSGSFT
jgi:hypothetical protein